jgi:hypothetical protein
VGALAPSGTVAGATAPNPASAVAGEVEDWHYLEQLLELARRHLGMELAYLSEFTAEEQVIRVASGDARAMNIAVGEGSSLQGSYCSRVLSGTLPSAIPDARRHLITRELPITGELKIGSYIGVPWQAPDGETAGMLCCISRGTTAGLDEEGSRFLRVVADLISNHMRNPAVLERSAAHEGALHVRAVLDGGHVRMVFQPVVRLDDDAVVGFESLARFDDPMFISPAHAFAAATRAGMGVELELLAAQQALLQLDSLPDGAWLSVNLSAEALGREDVQTMLLAHAHRQIGVELTEHTQVADYAVLVDSSQRVREAGVKLLRQLQPHPSPAPRHHQARHRAHPRRGHRPGPPGAGPGAGGLRQRHQRAADRRRHRDQGRTRHPARPRRPPRAGVPHGPPRHHE